jgi:hypothetical protein
MEQGVLQNQNCLLQTEERVLQEQILCCAVAAGATTNAAGNPSLAARDIAFAAGPLCFAARVNRFAADALLFAAPSSGMTDDVWRSARVQPWASL